jgi:WD40 repeat protein
MEELGREHLPLGQMSDRTLGVLLASLFVAACSSSAADPTFHWVPAGQGGSGSEVPAAQAGAAGAAENTSGWSWQKCGTLPAVVEPTDPLARGLMAVSVSPDGNWLVSTTGEQAYLWQLQPVFEDSVMFRLLDSGLELYGAFSDDSQSVIISGDDVAVFDVNTRALLGRPMLSPGIIVGCYSAFLAPAHRQPWFAGSHWDLSVTVWSGLDFQTLVKLPAPNCNIAAAFSADDSLLATSAAQLYRTSDWSLLWPPGAPLFGEPTRDDFPLLDSVQFVPGGTQVLLTHCAGPSPRVECRNSLFSTRTGELRATLPLVAARPSFSSDGSWLVAGGEAYHFASGSKRVLVHEMPAGSFTPQGNIVLGGSDGSLELWCRTP